MKKTMFNTLFVLIVMMTMSSCFTYTYVVGDGPQTGLEVKEKNHYLIYGLADAGISDPTEMAGDTENYEVTIQHTFIDGIIRALTFGIYTPTTTIVKK